MDERQEKDAAGQNQYGNPELNIGEYRARYGRPGRLPFVHQFPHFLWPVRSLSGKVWAPTERYPLRRVCQGVIGKHTKGLLKFITPCEIKIRKR